ncbi:MAG: ABC transporter ATP-binding protein, partial [Pedobacter sp.]
IQVTHAEKNARYGNRILHIEDGVVKKDDLLTNS